MVANAVLSSDQRINRRFARRFDSWWKKSHAETPGYSTLKEHVDRRGKIEAGLPELQHQGNLKLRLVSV